MNRIAYFFIIILLGASVSAFAQHPEFSTNLSSPQITSFAEDPDGHLWIGTSHGLNRFNGSSFMVYYAEENRQSIDNDHILALMQDNGGNLWIGTESGIRVFRHGKADWSKWSESVYNPVTALIDYNDSSLFAVDKRGIAKFKKENLDYEGGYYSSGISFLDKVTLSADNNLWFAYELHDSTFVSAINGEMERIFHAFLGRNNVVSAIGASSDGTIAVATEKGMHLFRGTEEVPVPHGLHELTHGKKVHFIVPRLSGMLVGIQGAGLFHYEPSFDEWGQILSNSITLEGTDYKCFLDSKDNIWLSDGRNGLKMYPESQQYSFLTVGLPTQRVSHLRFDADGFLWARIGETLTCLDPKTGTVLWENRNYSLSDFVLQKNGHELLASFQNTIVRYTLDNGFAIRKSVNSMDEQLFSIGSDREGAIWYTPSSGIRKVVPGGKAETVQAPDFSNYIYQSPESGRLFLFTFARGIYEILPDGSFFHFPHVDVTEDPETNASYISRKDIANVSTLHVGKSGEVWFGTYNNGLYRYDPSTAAVEHFGAEEGLSDRNIRSITQDREGNLWCSTTSHIVRLDVREKTFAVLHDLHYTGDHTYDLMSATTGPDGKIYFGGAGHITVIDPQRWHPRETVIPLFFESVSVSGEPFSTDVPLLDLDYRQNTLAFRFAGLDFESGNLLNYSWKLEGFDRDWQYGARDILASYSYLPAGKYTFRARVREQNGQWSSQELVLPVTIHPAPWASPWAKALFLLIAIGILGTGIWFVIRLRTQQERLKLAQQQEALKQEHIDFITNISHEYRTPLSMIYAPAKELASGALEGRQQELADTIVRNAERLKNLSEQTLTNPAAKEEADKLHVKETNLTELVSELLGNFRFSALEKGIGLNLEAPEETVCLADAEKVRKILSNLISNAVKYTPGDGHVTVSLSLEGGHARFTVKDDGEGIPEEKRALIFNRFERLGAEKKAVVGSGIGLNYAATLASLHKGSLSYEPASPKGSVFILDIPVTRDSYSPEEIVEGDYLRGAAHSPAYSGITPNQEEKDSSVLIVEDTADIRNYLSSLLAPHYNIVLAQDGLEAEDSLKTGLPDLVLSDVIMPGKNGFELCGDIKENPDWSHLPVVLLTAKADAESSVQGLRIGADAYVPKPFDPQYLLAVIDSQLRNRRILQQRVLNLTSTTLKEEPEKAEEAQLSPRDRFILDKIHTIVDKNLGNDQFGVEDLAGALGISYSSLYAKMKALTGKTPLFYINNYRMNRAKELLESRMYTVSEVAFKVGSLSPNTFSRDFKKHFGFTPTSVSKGKPSQP